MGNVIQAINVFRDVTADREADERRRFLLQAVDELNSSLDYESDAGGDRPPGGAGAGGLVRRRHRRGRTGETAGDGARRPGQAGGGDRELEKRYPPDPSSKTGVHEIVRTGEAQLIPEIPRELLTAAASRRRNTCG